MVAPINTRRVVCTVVRIACEEPADDLGAVALRIAARMNRYGADPIVARLVSELKGEANAEQPAVEPIPAPANRISRFYADERADLEPPSPAFDPDWDWRETPRWTFEDETPYDESYWWD